MTMGWMLLSLAVLLAGGGICALTNSTAGRGASRIGMATAVAGAVPAVATAVMLLITGAGDSLRLPWPVPFGSFYIALDPLSAFFVLTISLICALAAIYGSAYLDAWRGKKNLGMAWCFFNLLFASMLLVVLSRNGVLFLLAWEAMSLSSFFLVMFEHEKPEVREAGWVYLVAAHAGQACLIFLFVFLGGQNRTLDFDGFAVPASAAATGAMFLLAVAGFGAKAGFLPLHVWLPEAHPAAPSHVSAVMSGVMIKTGIYGLVRIVSLLGPPAPWWGQTLILVGAVSGVMGVLFALAQHDIKRLLAYHSVENIGIISLGLGLWLLGAATDNFLLAALGLMGGLLHVLNHAVFKGLLFFGAGAVVQATGSRDMDRMGGLQKRMPQTALAFAVGSAAICGLPPFNGFVSEFLVYLGAFGLVAKAGTPGGPLAGGLISLTALGLIGGLAAACFAKVFGIVFLGEPRSEAAAGAHEAPGAMRLVMTLLAVCCVILGLAGPLAVRLVNPVAEQLLGAGPASAASSLAGGLLWKISLGGAALIIIAVFLWELRRRLLAGRISSVGPTWDCGYAAPDSRMQYTASSFAWPVIDMFRWVVRPRLHVNVEPGLFPRQAGLCSHSDDIFRRGFFDPIFRAVSELARRVHVLQEGHNQLYVLYIAVTVLVLLLVKVR
ncbi:MAG: proton-conducting transporter membrane subunit [Thermodesulfobacteriota bacterium]